jgi:Sec7-like guanine-nucleotide exchange factor
MLNTDLHNVNIKKKMSSAQFVYNNRGINEGNNLPTDFLEDLYAKINSDELKVCAFWHVVL